MGTGLRYLATISVATVITLSVFYLMHRLIDQPPSSPPVMEPVVSIHFGPVEIPDPTVIPPPKKPPEPPEPFEQPPTDPLQVTQIETVPPQLDIDSSRSPHATGTPVLPGIVRVPGNGTDSDARPRVTVPPPYPRDAAIKGIEGWVRLEVLIGANGSVRSARVLASSPPRVFDDAAIRAVQRWSWSPQIVGGQPREQAVIQEIEFTLSGQ